MRHSRQRAFLKILSDSGKNNLTDLQILELGCGKGEVLLDLLSYSESPVNLHGTDILLERVREAQFILPQLALTCSDGQRLPYADGIFDLVIQSTVFSAVQHAQLPVKAIMQKEDSKEKVLDLINRIDEYVIDTNIYVKQDLTVVDISTALELHPKDVSLAINQHYNKNFNTYINEFRIKKAQELLRTDILNNLSIEGISREVGFHSKASFYAAFKKATGTTPMNYHIETSKS